MNAVSRGEVKGAAPCGTLQDSEPGRLHVSSEKPDIRKKVFLSVDRADLVSWSRWVELRLME